MQTMLLRCSTVTCSSSWVPGPCRAWLPLGCPRSPQLPESLPQMQRRRTWLLPGLQMLPQQEQELILAFRQSPAASLTR